MRVTWHDAGIEPSCPPNPKYPNGIDLDASHGSPAACTADLPYPAKRCGTYLIECPDCGQCIRCTTAGRPDDPKSIKIPCRSVKPTN